MAITTHLYGPEGALPNLFEQEWQWLRLVGDGTEVIVPAGYAVLYRVHVGVVGTLAKFYDVASGGTTNDTTEVATVDTSALGERFRGPVLVSKGLTVITTGAGDLTILFRGRAIPVTSRTFGA